MFADEASASNSPLTRNIHTERSATRSVTRTAEDHADLVTPASILYRVQQLPLLNEVHFMERQNFLDIDATCRYLARLTTSNMPARLRLENDTSLAI